MTWVLLEKIEILAGEILNLLGQLPETLPKLRRGTMHLQVSQLALLLCRLGFAQQKIELARQ